MVRLGSLVAASLLLSQDSVVAWTLASTKGVSRTTSTALHASLQEDDFGQSEPSRRDYLKQSAVFLGVAAWSVLDQPAEALVKGVAPPPPRKASGDTKPKCTNVEECQAMAEKREQELREKEELGPPPKVTRTGIKYRDVEDGTGDVEVKDGDDIEIYYKVLKLGKRSYDGISGEGTVVFSRGYGLEDDEDKAGVKSFKTTVGAYSNIAALNEAVIGMKVGGLRRFSIVPQKGWEKPTKACDGGPGGGGNGGDIRTDYVVVPTATMVEQEACFDTSKKPFPVSYAQQRRMAQRFDQSLIMEVQVVKVD
ncbi:unnamed protein product [Cylindrotheca closterium]|uniref:Peptidylprolyl isomerase n=1 Tax=Cylindrotheca closterium TaxID=2856 RepID=A0AAD2FG98_9STRA|nr:unnamed protein product [Cylindrotheca closterium]